MSNDKILNKVTKITSPVGQVGVTTLANYLGLMYANKGYLTAVIELNRYYATSPYIQDVVEEHKEKSLSLAIESNDDSQVINTFIQSKHHDSLFTLSLRVNNEIHDLHKYGIGQIDRIIRLARGRFDKVFVDAPMNYLDNGFFASIHSRPDQTFVVMDENVANWQALKKYDVFLKSIKTQYKDVYMVVNKHHGILTSDFFKEMSKDLEILKFNDVITIPYMPEIIRNNNDGVILADQLIVRKKDKQMSEALEAMVKNIEKRKESAVVKEGLFRGVFSKKTKQTKVESGQDDQSYSEQKQRLRKNLMRIKKNQSSEPVSAAEE